MPRQMPWTIFGWCQSAAHNCHLACPPKKQQKLHSARQVGGSEKMGSQGECGGREEVGGRCGGGGNGRGGTALLGAATQGEEKEQAGAWGAWKQRLRADTAYSALLNSVLDSAKPLGPKNTLWSNDTCGQWCSPDRQRFTIFHA